MVSKFIERITEGGKPKFPPISQLIPHGFKMSKESFPVVAAPQKEQHADMIIAILNRMIF